MCISFCQHEDYGELVHLANSAKAYEDWACEAINDIHNLADKFNGSVSQRDAEIKNVRNFARTQERQKMK
jgi:hypothetical protein